jgi:hypothetical protein
MDEILVKSVKKVIRWGKGYSVFVTKEAKLMGWNDKTYVSVSAVDRDGEKMIVIRKVDVK